MKAKLSCIVLFALGALNSAHAANISSSDTQVEHDLIITGEALAPGGYVKGYLPQCISYTLNGVKGTCGAQGEFIFGFGRDDALSQTVTFTLPEDKTLSKSFELSSREYDVQRINGVPKKMVTPPESVSARIKSDNIKIGKARAVNSNLNAFMQDFIWPAKGRISGVYGSQRVFNDVPKRPHFGLDVAAKIGEPVVAPADGVVKLAHDDMYYSGGTLIIDHGQGLTSTYIHLSKIEVKTGQVVQQGELVARIGNTGRVTGPHLDWRINWFNQRLDPAFWVKEGGNKP